MIKHLAKKFPSFGNFLYSIKKKFISSQSFTTSEKYWNERYKKGGNSGAGSYDQLAIFKGEVVNDFVNKYNVQTVIEFGCGDGNQLKYFDFQSYIGFDVSTAIIEHCKVLFQDDASKKFLHQSAYNSHKAELTLSLDVIYHLIEDEVYESYMNHLFDASTAYVIIYSCNFEKSGFAEHVKPRKFTDWVNLHQPEFELISMIPNKFPYKENKAESTSFADFYIYRKK